MQYALTNPARQREIISRRLLRAMALLVLSTLLLVTYASLTDRPLEALPVDGPIAQERVIHIVADGMSGAATITDEDGEIIADLSPTQGGFIAGVWRAVAYEREKNGTDLHAPVRLMRFTDGRLALRDDIGGSRFELVGFGQDNAAAFARLLDQ